jgi:hypothetical protein
MTPPESLVKNFSWKFYVGIVLIIVSLIAGGIIKVLLLFELNRPILWWTLLVAYLLTWPILIWGIWWAGKEYADKIKRYVSYRFYHESLRDGTRKVAVHARDRTKKFAVDARDKTRKFAYDTKAKTKKMTLTAYGATKKIHDRARAGTAKIGEQVKSRLSKVRMHKRKK